MIHYREHKLNWKLSHSLILLVTSISLDYLSISKTQTTINLLTLINTTYLVSKHVLRLFDKMRNIIIYLEITKKTQKMRNYRDEQKNMNH